MIRLLLQGLWYILPAIVANMAPVFARNLVNDRFNWPVDFNKKFRGKPILGDHKTYRGLVAGVILSILFAYLQIGWYSTPWVKELSLIDYNRLNFWLWGFLMGFGALFGDMLKSFFKRRVNVKPGRPWIPFDQIDWLVGALLFTVFTYVPPLNVLAVIFLLMPFIAIAAVRIGYWLKIRKVKF